LAIKKIAICRLATQSQIQLYNRQNAAGKLYRLNH